MVSFAFAIHQGYVRRRQEDAYGHVGAEFFVVADGLGGHPAGDVAANIAVEQATKTYKLERKQEQKAEKLLASAFQEANRLIVSKAKKDPTLCGMCTTMVAALVKDSKWWMANVGDSRGYIFRHDKLQRITSDHEDLSGFITKVVGMEEVTPDIFSGRINKNELLLSTDGLFNTVSDDKIEKVLREKDNLFQKADRLIQLALEAGGKDNITVCLIS